MTEEMSKIRGNVCGEDWLRGPSKKLTLGQGPEGGEHADIQMSVGNLQVRSENPHKNLMAEFVQCLPH